MGRLFDLEEEGYFYTRLQNPTNDCVAQKICELEGGAAAMLTSSGQAANYYAVFNICGAGDHVIMSSSVYGGTFNLLTVTMQRMGYYLYGHRSRLQRRRTECSISGEYKMCSRRKHCESGTRGTGF